MTLVIKLRSTSCMKSHNLFAIFKSYKACLKKEIGAYIRCLRTDKGGDFNSNDFVEFCKANGVSK